MNAYGFYPTLSMYLVWNKQLKRLLVYFSYQTGSVMDLDLLNILKRKLQKSIKILLKIKWKVFKENGEIKALPLIIANFLFIFGTSFCSWSIGIRWGLNTSKANWKRMKDLKESQRCVFWPAFGCLKAGPKFHDICCSQPK